MNPRLSAAGSSFKWSCYYMSHDKQAATSERLGFVDLLNFPFAASGDGVTDSERAAKVMAFTAMNWEDLQRLHHDTDPDQTKPYRKPPRPPEKSVLTYSLRFHPDDTDKVTPKLLKTAAVKSLSVLGLNEHQAVIYEHTDYDGDEPHPPHVHVVVNKVHPITGKSRNHTHERPFNEKEIAADPSRAGKLKKINNSKLELSKFCEAFGKEHGLKRVAQREENNNRRAHGDFVRYKGDLPRADLGRFQDYENKPQVTVERERREQQETDRHRLEARHALRRRDFENKLQQRYAPAREDIKAELAKAERTVKLDHLPYVFKVVTRLKQRVTGELKREQRRIHTLKTKLQAVDNSVQQERDEHEQRLAADQAKMHKVHAAQLKRDKDYFQWQRDRKKKVRSTRKPDIGQDFNNSSKKTKTVEASADAVDAFMKRKKKYSRKDGRGANREQGRSRPQRVRKR